LTLDSILADSVKGFDFKMSFDPFKEKFNFPAVSVKFSYRDGLQTKVIGHKVIQSAIRKVLVGNDVKHIRIFFRGIGPVKRNELIFKYSIILINFKVLNNCMAEIVFCSCDKECILGSDLLIKPTEISITFIHNVVRNRFYGHRKSSRVCIFTAPLALRNLA